jgi:hypothetical protein
MAMPPPPLLEDDLACHAIVATSLLNNSAVAWIYAGTCCGSLVRVVLF